MTETDCDSDERGREKADDKVPDVYDRATIRDIVWTTVLELLSERPIPFQAWRVREHSVLEERHNRTIRRTLSAMTETGWLEHEAGKKWYRAGEKAREHLKRD